MPDGGLCLTRLHARTHISTCRPRVTPNRRRVRQCDRRHARSEPLRLCRPAAITRYPSNIARIHDELGYLRSRTLVQSALRRSESHSQTSAGRPFLVLNARARCGISTVAEPLRCATPRRLCPACAISSRRRCTEALSRHERCARLPSRSPSPISGWARMASMMEQRAFARYRRRSDRFVRAVFGNGAIPDATRRSLCHRFLPRLCAAEKLR